jgi:hypothetical protein
MANEKKFADGFIFKRRDNSPDWVVGKLSIKVDQATEFLIKNDKNGWLNLNINQSKMGAFYVELDVWEPAAANSVAPPGLPTFVNAPVPFDPSETDDLPF